MINLEQKQIFDGRYMQGMQIRVDKITPILEHMQALLLLPKAMRWMGEANFEITAMSDMRNDGSVEINRYVSLRICVSESSKQWLQKAVREAAEHVRAWLQSISVVGELVVYDDEGMFGRMPASGYTLVVKDKRAKHYVNPFERLTLPLREGFSINPEEIAEVLCQRPCSGVTLQLSPSWWSYNEVNTLRRYAQGAGISEDRLRRTINDKVVCFTCALWGEGASAIADLLVGGHESGLQVSALQLHQEEFVRMLAVDPWTLHRRVAGASRYCGILMMAEMKSLFHCVPLEFAGLRESLEPDEAVVREIRSLVEKKCAQMLADNEEWLSRAQAEMRKTVSESEMRTAQQHEAWMQETKTEARKIADESAKSVLKQVQIEQDAIEKKVGDAYNRVTQELDRSKVSFAEQMQKMQRDVDAVRTQQQHSLVGVAEKRLDALFADAAQYEMPVICIDEIDTLCPQRDAEGIPSHERALVTEFLQHIDGVSGASKAVIIGATNYPWKVDSALRSRLATAAYVGLPSEQQIGDYLYRSLRPYLGEDEEFAKSMIALCTERLEHASYRELKWIVSEVARISFNLTTSENPTNKKVAAFVPIAREDMLNILSRVNYNYDAAYMQRLQNRSQW